MQLSTGLMMTATALFQEVESPLGTAGSMFAEGEDRVPPARDPNEGRAHCT